MILHPKNALLSGAAALAIASAALAEVVTYPAPAEEKLSEDYQVWADGKPVDVYTARVLDPPFAGRQWDFGGPYSFANFDTSGPVTVRISSKRGLGATVVRPSAEGAELAVEDDHTILLKLDGPKKLSIEPEGKRGPLLLFANPIQSDAPKTGDPDVIHFGPGVHEAGAIEVGDGQTLHLAGGAVVKGAVIARGSNIRICGRGILDGSDYEWRKGPHNVTVGIYGSDVTVCGITIRGSSHWTIVPRGSRNVTIRNVKLCNGRVQNDDGINPCNSQDVLITDCFIRSDDDCVALKGLDFEAAESNVERITVENSILWCDRARIFLLGHESRARFMRDVTLRNLDIIHFSMTPFLFEPGEDMRLENIRVEDVRIHGEGQNELIRLRPVVNQYMRKQVPGFIRDVRFRNVAVEGGPGAYKVQLAGADQEHDVEDVAFEDVSILGKALAADSENVAIGEHVSRVRFGRPPRAARSVHLRYPAPDAVVFYNELTVEQSVPGSYFMACGFNHGYFGIQEQGRGRKVVLFSVWDPTRGDDPNAVAEEERVEVLFKADDVLARRFGGEGTGGQSFFNYDWTTGQTCRFLVKAEVSEAKTAYAAYFFLPETGRWKHLVTFRTRSGGDPLRGLYSFVEDFRRDFRSAQEQRRATFGNGWVCDADGRWTALTKAQFTASGASWEAKETIDAGVTGRRFYLQTGGETRMSRPLGSSMERETAGDTKPQVPEDPSS